MPFPIGDGRINSNPCSLEDLAQNVAEVIETIDEKFAETEGGVPGRWDEKVINPGTFVVEIHQDVFYEIVGGQIRLFTVAGGAGTDTYQVKVDVGGVPGFLDTKIHANTWQVADTFGTGTHFTILAANVADAVRFYAPYNIIKTSAGDGSPGYLGQKFTDLGTFNGTTHFPVLAQDVGTTMKVFAPWAIIKNSTSDGSPGTLASKFTNAGTYSASTHILANFQDLGSTIRFFVAKSSINVLIEEFLALGLQVQVVAITTSIAAPTWNATTAKLTPTACEFPVFYLHPDDDGTWTIDEETTTTFSSFLKVAIPAPATGKYSRGLVSGGKLMLVQCEEEDLPIGWEA